MLHFRRVWRNLDGLPAVFYHLALKPFNGVVTQPESPVGPAGPWRQQAEHAAAANRHPELNSIRHHHQVATRRQGNIGLRKFDCCP